MFLRTHALIMGASILAVSGVVFAKGDGKGSGSAGAGNGAPTPVLAGAPAVAPAPILPGVIGDLSPALAPVGSPGTAQPIAQPITDRSGDVPAIPDNNATLAEAAAAQPHPVIPVAAPAGKREAPQIGDIMAGFAKPAAPTKSPRGGKASYPFEKLEVGQSFPVYNKSLKNVNSTVASCNKRQPQVVLEGQFVEVDLPGGGKGQAQKMGKAKVFSAAEVPAGEYNGVKFEKHVRVWRDA